MRIKGVVDSVYTKQVNTKRGPADVYHAIIDGNDLNMGFKPVYEEGQYVDVEVYEKYNEYHISKSGNKQSGAPAKSGGNNTQRASTPAFPVAKNTKDTSICRQNALTNARSLVDTLLASGAVKYKDEQTTIDLILTFAYQFADFSTGQREVKMAEAKAAYKEDE